MAYDDDGGRRVMLRQLRYYNKELAKMRVAARVPMKTAREAESAEELRRLMAVARHHYLDVLYQLRGTV